MVPRTTLPRSSKSVEHADDSEAARIARISARTGWRWFDPRHPKKHEMFERIPTDLGPKAQRHVEQFEKNRYIFNAAFCICRHVKNRQKDLFGESIAHIVNENMERIVVENVAFKPRNHLPPRATPKSKLVLYSVTAEELEKEEQNTTQFSNPNPENNTKKPQEEIQNVTKYYTHAHSRHLTPSPLQLHPTQEQKPTKARIQEATRKLLESVLLSDAYIKGLELPKPESYSLSAQKPSAKIALVRARELLLFRMGNK